MKAKCMSTRKEYLKSINKENYSELIRLDLTMKYEACTSDYSLRAQIAKDLVDANLYDTYAYSENRKTMDEDLKVILVLRRQLGIY